MHDEGKGKAKYEFERYRSDRDREGIAKRLPPNRGGEHARVIVQANKFTLVGKTQGIAM